MSIQIPPGFAHIDMAFRHSTYQRDAHVTFGVDIQGDPDFVASGCLDAWMDAYNGRLDSQVTLREVTATIGQDGGDPTIQVAPNTTAGARSGDSGTVALALLVSKRTGLGGRRNGGRSFLPWMIADTEVNELGIVTGSVVTSMQERADDFFDYLTTVDLPMVILHRTGVTAVPAPTLVTSLLVEGVISTQRRRQVRNP